MRSLMISLRYIGLAALAAVPLAMPLPGLAADTDGPPAAASPVEEFNKQLGEIKKGFESLSGKIEQGTKDIEKLTAPGSAREQIAGMQAMIADTLGAVSDNGDVAKLGQKTLDYARAKQKQLETESKYTPEERQFLLNEWRRISAETERAAQDLAEARAEFSQLLRVVQTRGDYIEELQALNNAQKMLEVIKQLAGEIRSASGAMRSFIHTVTPPSPGT